MPDIEIKGLSELLKAMQELPKAIQQKCLRRAMVPAAQLIRNAAKVNLAGVVKKKSGLLDRAIRLAYNRKESTPGKAIYHVFVSQRVRGGQGQFATGRKAIKKLRKSGYTGDVSPAYYWRFIEFYKKGRGATPFMRPAFDSNVGTAAESIKNKLAELIEKEALALGK